MCIQLNGSVVQNNPHLSFSDQVQLEEVAVGKDFDSSFLQSMNIDNLVNIELDTTNYTSSGANINTVELEDQSNT